MFILFCRDGVSNSEFVDTMNDELTSLKAAMNRLASDYAPTISYVVIQKRHRTRFFVECDEFARLRLPSYFLTGVFSAFNRFFFFF